MPKITNTLLDLPENDDSMDCPDCLHSSGILADGFGTECSTCDGEGVVSERHYNDIKSLERDESDL